MKLEVLDACCGSRMMYFNKEAPFVTYQDCRVEEDTLCDGRKLIVSPDILGDYTKMSFKDESFNLIIYDPPHLKVAGDNSWIKKKYGRLPKEWKKNLSEGFIECWRVLSKGGTLIFKWNETQIKIKEILGCFPVSPLFGHTTTQNLKTHWIVFYKAESL